jgi:hypothetical protein
MTSWIFFMNEEPIAALELVMSDSTWTDVLAATVAELARIRVYDKAPKAIGEVRTVSFFFCHF